jgi:pimeloyl-ACP methyl ester carboxylesterase
MAIAVEQDVLRAREPSRARYPDSEGYAERDGVRLYWERYGEGHPTLLFLPPGPITHSRAWKAQIPYFARHARAVAFDPRGGGRSSRPRGVAEFATPEMAKDALAVMDASDTEQAVVVGISAGARHALWLIANHPDRFAGAALVAPFLPLTRWQPIVTSRRTYLEPRARRRIARMLLMELIGLPRNALSAEWRRFNRCVDLREGITMFGSEAILRDQRAYIEWFVRTIAMPDPHSTRLIEDAVEWGMEAEAQALVDSHVALDIADDAILTDRTEILEYCSRVRCPVLVIQGELDLACPPQWGRELARATGARYIEVPGTGHLVGGRKPVAVNRALREFAESLPA